MDSKNSPAPDADFSPVDRDTWRAQVERELKGRDFGRVLVRRSREGLRVQPLYTAEDGGLPEPEPLPGAAPWRRGARIPGHREVRIAQRHADPRADSLSEAVSQDLEGGADGVELALDQAARWGGEGLAGEGGAAIADLDELSAVLEGGDWAGRLIRLDAGGNALAAGAMILAALRDQGVDPDGLELQLLGDPLGALARDGRLHRDLDGAWDELAALVAATSGWEGLRALGVSTAPYQDAGADAGRELGWALSAAWAALRALTKRGLSPRDVAAAMVFTVPMGRDLLTGLAKLRGLRLLWGRTLQVCGVENPPAPRIHATTARSMLSRRDPWVNMLRATTAAFQGILGGADSLGATPFDVLLGQPERLGRRVARNTLLVLREEAHLGEVIDPAGGAWAVESRTGDLARLGWERFQEVEGQGGLAAALESGWAVGQLEGAWAERLDRIARREVSVVGVSEYPDPQPAPPERWAGPDEGWRQALAERRAHAQRSELPDLPGFDAPEALLGALIEAAQGGADFAQLNGASRGDGEPARALALPPRRDAQPFEALRDRLDALRGDGPQPAIWLATIGSERDYSARATWATDALSASGLAVRQEPGPGGVDPAAFGDRFLASGARIACICGTDAAYAAIGEAVAAALTGAGARRVLLAGRPGDAEQALRDAGVDDFIHLGSDLLSSLDALITCLEEVSS